MNKGVTTIKVKEETRKKLQLRKQERDLKNVDEVIEQALNTSGALLVSEKKEKKK